ncbi:transposase [Clostridium isatidis]|uniref:transposase n=1 Tax=Clostridium isatidis TaxID=182773 RepID=UPI00169BC967|nr:transposase [Clostridiales bacterium]
MTYKKRQWWPGATLHITARGNHRNDIFRDEEDFQVYLEYIEEAVEYYEGKFEVYGYCLMDNHVHLLVKTEDMHISYLISRVHSIYAKFFNKKYKYIGHLFQDRYFTELIEDDVQILSTIRYIHLNPVRANMVKKPEDYNWSSYSMTIGLKNEKLINSKRILDYFISKYSRELYRAFVESAIKEKYNEEDEEVGISS